MRKDSHKITTSTIKILTIVREHYEKLYANKLDNLQEMDNFLETLSPTKTEAGSRKK